LVPAAVQQFGQGQVEAGFRLGPGLHRHAEARPAGRTAVDGDQERALTLAGVNRVDVLATRNTRSWIAIARSSHERTPMNAIGGPASAPTTPSPLRQTTLVEGNRYFF